MTGRLEKIGLPAHWKNPNAKLKDQDESGPSGSADPRPDAARAAAPASAHTPGQDAPVMLHGPSRFRPEHEGNSSSESGTPRSEARLSPRSADSSLPSWIEGGAPRGNPDGQETMVSPGPGVPADDKAGLTLQEYLERPIPSPGSSPTAFLPDPQGACHSREGSTGGEGGTPASNTPSSGGSGSVNDIFALLGGSRIRNWNDLSASLNRADDYSPRLDNHPLIARHLNPDVASPVQHRRVLWTRLPGPNHPLFGEYMAVHNPAFYPSRLAERASQPMAGRPHREAVPAEDGKAGLRRAHSMPGDLPHLSRPVEGGTVAGDRAVGASPREREIRSEAGDGAEGATRREGEARTDADGNGPRGSASRESAAADESRLEALAEENARLRKNLKEATAKAVLGGIAAAGVGLAAGLLIESMMGSSGSGQAGSPPANPT
jgi:hypothetical protein